jgi:hypothetical protein
MTEDEVVREVRAARKAFAASHGYDLAEMVAALREVAAASGHKVLRLAPRPAIPAGPGTSCGPASPATAIAWNRVTAES